MTNQQKDKSTSKITNQKELYNILCHDEPTISSNLTISFITTFSNTLIHSHFSSNKEKFGLCNRLVDGLLFILLHSSNNTSRNNDTLVDEGKNEEKEDESKSNDKLKRCFAELAFHVFTQCPLLILQQMINNNKMECIYSVLGSYTSDIITQEESVNKIPSALQDTTLDDDDLIELIAEESDPDDYEYESSATTATKPQSQFYFDPDRISTSMYKPNKEIILCMLSLLRQINYKALGLNCITEKRWMDLDISNKLLKLVDVIISFIDRDELFKDMNENEKGNCKNMFQDHLATILSVVIQRSMDTITSSTASIDIMSTLLKFLDKLIQKNDNGKYKIPPLVLQCLSNLCNPTMNNMNPRQKDHLNLFLFEHLDRIAEDIESSRRSFDKVLDDEATLNKITFLVSIFHYITTTIQSNDDNTLNKLQSSGTYRESILLYISLSISTNTNISIIQKMIFASLLDLLSNDKDLILFLVRIPSFMNLFQMENYRDTKGIQVVIWSILFMDLDFDPTEQQTALKLRSKKTNETSKMNLYQVHKYCMKLQCTKIQSSLEVLISFTKSNELNENDIQECIIHNNFQLVLDEFIQLIHCITTIPKLANNLQKIFLLEKDYYKDICDTVKKIQSTLHQLSSSNQFSTTSDVKDDEDKKITTAIQVIEKKLTLKNNDNLLQLLRKNIKVFYSFLMFECDTTGADTKLDYFVGSSKAD